MNATAKDLRFHSKDLLDTVSRGEEVIITFRGKPCAKLIPFEAVKRTSKNGFFGIWKDDERTKNVDNYVRELRKGRF
jgi:prevent-host-death family protein